MRPRNFAALFAAALLLAIINLNCFKKQEKEITGAGEPLFTLTGRVFDVDNGRTVQGAVVQIKALGLSDTVDANGTYHFANLKVGSRSLEISAPRHALANVLVTFQYEQRDVVQDVAMTKLLEVAFSGELPFANASGLWREGSQLLVTKFDTMGGNVYRLDESLNVLQISPRLGTLTADTCWADSMYVPCVQRLYGLVRVGEYFYVSDGSGHVGFFDVNERPLTEPHFFKIDAQTLAPITTLMLNGSFGFRALSLVSDLEWDGQTLWLCERGRGTFPKVNLADFSPRAIFSSPRSSPIGLAWDGRYMWMSTTTELLQLRADLSIRNRYAVPNAFIEQIAWDGEFMWAVHGGSRRIYKFGIPFEDHL